MSRVVTVPMMRDAYDSAYLRAFQRKGGEPFKDRVRQWLRDRGVTRAKAPGQMGREEFMVDAQKGFVR